MSTPPAVPNFRPGVNEYSTPVTVFNCTACGHEVSVCPALDTPEKLERFGTECLGDTCPSYRIERDAGIFFEPALAAGWIQQAESR